MREQQNIDPYKNCYDDIKKRIDARFIQLGLGIPTHIFKLKDEYHPVELTHLQVLLNCFAAYLFAECADTAHPIKQNH